MNLNEATRAFIRAHTTDDVLQLALRGTKDPQVDLPFALQQIEGRQKAQAKLPEHFAQEEILYPVTQSMEQCSSAITADYKATLIKGTSLADLSGGFGVDTFAFARHFQHCTYIEPQPGLCDIVRHNATVFGLDNIEIRQGTMEEQMGNIGQVDWLYVDPSRRDSHGRRVVTLEACTPDLTQCLPLLHAHARKGVLAKLSPLIDLGGTLRQLPETAEIHVVAVNGECKEVLFLLRFEGKSPDTPIKIWAINFVQGQPRAFAFTLEEEAAAKPVLAANLGSYLYEPNAAILKAGAFKCLATRFGIQKLHPHSHLYTSDTLLPDFPGRTFSIMEQIPFGKRAATAVAAITDRANVAVRNFPLTAEELKAKLKLKDGGDVYLFGTTLSGGDKTLLLCKRMP